MFYSRFFKFCLLLVDLILLDMSFNFAHANLFGFGSPFSPFYESLFVIFNLTWIVTALYSTMYRINRFSQLRHILSNALFAIVLHILFIMVLTVTFKNHTISYTFLYITYPLFITLIIAVRVVFYFINKNYNKLGLRHKKYVIIGAGNAGKSLYDFFEENQTLGFKCMGIFDDASETKFSNDHLVKGAIADLKVFCKEENVEEIYFTLPLTRTDLIKEITEFADDNFIYFRISPDFSELMQKNLNVDFYGNIPIISIRNEPLGITVNRIAKRCFDIIFSLFIICFIFPVLFPILAIIIKLESKGPVFFKQLRPGRKNQLFTCYKFRTMRLNNQTELQASKNDNRITRFGSFLRRNSLDELPQFFNVLLGDMSVVGPRPNMISQLESYSKTINKYALRHFVSPGITGFAQIKGYRGETQQLDLMQKRVEYDAMYMENWSFTLDLKIIMITIWNLFRGEDKAY